MPDGRAFIADFLFERYGKKIYFEIVGFWTAQYLKRKFKKIYEISKLSDNKNDLLVAINENSFVSESGEIKNLLSDSILDYDKIIVYKKDSIPMKKIIFYLKSIDSQIMNQNLETYRSVMTEYIVELLNKNQDIIDLEEISKTYGVSINSISNIISNLRTNNHIQKYIIQNSLLISERKLNEIDIMDEPTTLRDGLYMTQQTRIKRTVCMTNLANMYAVLYAMCSALDNLDYCNGHYDTFNHRTNKIKEIEN